jgi:hypothetical protein
MATNKIIIHTREQNGQNPTKSHILLKNNRKLMEPVAKFFAIRLKTIILALAAHRSGTCKSSMPTTNNLKLRIIYCIP